MIDLGTIYDAVKSRIPPSVVIALLLLFAGAFAVFYKTAYEVARNQRDDYKTESELWKDRAKGFGRTDSVLTMIHEIELDMPIRRFSEDLRDARLRLQTTGQAGDSDSVNLTKRILNNYETMLNVHRRLRSAVATSTD